MYCIYSPLSWPYCPSACYQFGFRLFTPHSFDRFLTKDTLIFAQASYMRQYNNRQLTKEFDLGDLMLLNSHSLKLHGNNSSVGKKLIQHYDGPFEVTNKMGPVTYQIWLPSSYRIHPVCQESIK